MRRPLLFGADWPFRIVTVAALGVLPACSSGGDDEPANPMQGSAGASAGSPTTGGGGGGAGGSGGSPVAGTSSGGAAAGAPLGGNGGQGGVPSGGGAAGMGGSGGVPGAGGNLEAGTSGAPPQAGASGNAGGPSAGTGGESSGGTNAGGAAGDAGSGNAGGTVGGGGGGSGDIDCPTGATFCSGFEDASLPSTVRFHAVGPNEPNPYTFDTAVKRSGSQSLSIPQHSGGFYYRALAVPVPGNDFWVRLYVRVSREFGDNGHDSLFGASSGNLEADVNNEALVEFSEQFDTVLLNTDDQLFQPETSHKLAADTWHCIEAHYNGANGEVQIFANGMELLHATNYAGAKQTFQSFRIGYMQYHDTRAVWFDDVVVAPTRVPCAP